MKTTNPRNPRKVRSEASGRYLATPVGTVVGTGADDSANVDDEEEILAKARAILLRRLKEAGPIHPELGSPPEVKQYLRHLCVLTQHEIFGCLFLNNRHEVLAVEELFRGTIDGASVYPREVVKRALELNAIAVIFFHNHPSGNPEPSEADTRLTQRLKDALRTVDIRTLDHIIVGREEELSFAETGRL